MINDKKIKLILFDVDNTLVYGNATKKFYSQYSIQLEKTLARYLDIKDEEAKIVADSFRKQFNGHGESSFNALKIGIDIWYEEILNINPSDYLEPINKTNELLEKLKQKGYVLGAITDGPTKQSERILKTTGIKYNLLDFLIGWEKGKEMPKNGSKKIYEEMCIKNNLKPDQILMVGDSIHTDILPAKEFGLDTIFIRGEKEKPKGIKSVRNIEELI